MSERNLFILWLRATWFGWLLGVPIIIVLALIGETVGIGGAQVLVGVGMGIGVGFMQSRAIRNILNRSTPWVWTTIIGLGLPFLATDLSKFVGWNLPYSLLMLIAVGGLIAGVWQAFILSSQVHKIFLWTAASAVGWFFAAVTSSLADSLPRLHTIRGIWGALLYLGIVAAGGLIPGAVTGICLARMFRQQSAV
ncbi:MAG TPA: hypothetical protein VF556_06105 [Pyrinomonadaceae bacterium]|jgi:hypothetical protein